MKTLIIDTDIGNDCDDAGALAIAHNLSKKGECVISAFTSNTSRLDGAQAIQIINRHYGQPTPVGMTSRTSFLDAEHGYGAYSRGLVDAYPHYLNGQIVEDAVGLLRKTLAQSESKPILVCIGPLNNISDLMRSGPCLYSDLYGLDLIRKTVGSFVIMGGEFTKRSFVVDGNTVVAEWNLLQDLEAAIHVINNLDVPSVFIPYSVGLFKTGQSLFTDPAYDSPIRLSYDIHSKGPRYSWDPVAVYYAVRDDEALFEMSGPGRVSITSDGRTSFTADPNGPHTYMKRVKDEEEAVVKLNSLMR